MNAKGLRLLAAATLVIAALAAFSLNRSSSADAGEATRGSTFYDGLLDQVNDVARLEITRGEESFAIVRAGDAWGIEDRGGYPVKFETVKQIIVGVADLKTLEQKTKNPAYHSKLGVDDPTDPDGQAKRVTLKDASGTTLASLVVGNSKYGSSPSLYVRREGEDQAWQCSGRLNITTDALSWIERKVAQIERDRIAGAVLTHPDGEVLSTARASKNETEWALAELPPGRALTSPAVTSSIATWLTYLSLDDVRSADAIDFAADAGPTLESRCFDGFVVRIETAQAEDKTWAKLTASYEAPPEPTGSDDGEGAAPEEGEAEHTEHDGHDHGDADPALDAGAGKTAEEVLAEVEEFNSRHAAWAYALPDYKVTQLEKRIDDLLEPLPEPEEELEPEDMGGVSAEPAEEAPAEE